MWGADVRLDKVFFLSMSWDEQPVLLRFIPQALPICNDFRCTCPGKPFSDNRLSLVDLRKKSSICCFLYLRSSSLLAITAMICFSPKKRAALGCPLPLHLGAGLFRFGN